MNNKADLSDEKAFTYGLIKITKKSIILPL